MLVGDLNIDLTRDNAHSRRIIDFAERYGLFFAKDHVNSNYDFIYLNERAGHHSAIDYYILSHVLEDCVENVECVENVLNPSCHVTLNIFLNIEVSRMRDNVDRNIGKKVITWYRVSDETLLSINGMWIQNSKRLIYVYMLVIVIMSTVEMKVIDSN